ncbi:acyl-CoA reductase [Marinoscillum furvescens]|uniref:Acyl-CoA reductase LuxC n=1 Tax=Marinoscillum furvescens DSM 4134 TaxID=1122208 RepID=A0A3D9L8L5_MARFU|nr:acyl-CoA reductase [Marinoscillum furvescens]REE01217.1 acyl-CoA reductase LuxC [Marinoscillum furvescens DSM 4134]
MTLAERIEAFSILGDKIKNISRESLEDHAFRAKNHNQWFTEDNVKRALDGVAYLLEKPKLESWVANYNNLTPKTAKVVGIIMAGNIPLVGFHDLLCVLISGHKAAIKLSSQDEYLMKLLINWLTEISPDLAAQLEIRERLNDVEALIATGSDNTARYFEYYFKDHPKIIRKNRTSIAILDGSETSEELEALGKDIFWYFGLGCRNVSKLFVPKGYNPQDFFEAIESYKSVGDHFKYRNNYDYHKSIYLVNGKDHLDNGFLLFTQTDELVSPISVLYAQEYSDTNQLRDVIAGYENKIQCIVGKDHIPFGTAQLPEVTDYADNVDTMKFLTEL